MAVPAELCAEHYHPVGPDPETGLYSVESDLFDVTFVDEDGETVLFETNVLMGTTAEYIGATPTKAPDVQYSYAFAGWTPKIEAVANADQTYTATYSATLNPVAMVVSADGATTNKYDTLVDGALKAIKNGETLVLLRDDATLENLQFSKSITLDLNGFTLSTRNSYLWRQMSGTLTVIDSRSAGTMDSPVCAMSAEGTSTVNILGGTYVASDTGKVSSMLITVGSATMSISGNVIVRSTEAGDYAIKVGSGSRFLAYDGVTVQSAYGFLNSGTVEIHGGTFNAATGFLWANNAGATFAIYGGRIEIGSTGRTFGQNHGTVVVEGGSISSRNNIPNGSTTLPVVRGGWWSSNANGFGSGVPIAYCADGYIPSVNVRDDFGDGLTYHTVGFAMASVVGHDGSSTAKYETLAEAVASAEDGDTVTLLADVELDSALDIGKSITLDLGGYGITTGDANEDGYAIGVSGGEVLIAGDGAVDAGLDLALWITGGEVTIANGAFGAIGIDDGDVTITSGLFNGGIMTAGGATAVNGGTFNDVVDVGGGAVTINDGVFAAIDNVLMVTDAEGVLTVNGGTFTAEQSGEGEPIVVYVEGGSARLTSGTFSGGTIATDLADTGTIAVSGGAFSCAVPEQYCAEGYIPEEHEVAEEEATRTVYGVVAGWKVTFVDEDGETVLFETNVAVGATAEYLGATPAKAPTVQYSYAFAGWTPALAPVSDASQTYTATYSATLNAVTVTVPPVAGTVPVVTTNGVDVACENGGYCVFSGTEVVVAWVPDGAYVVSGGSTTFTANGNVVVGTDAGTLPTATAAVAQAYVSGALTYFTGLLDAVNAADAGSTVTLLADDTSLSGGAEMEIAKSLTITGAVDANGEPLYTIYGKAGATGTNYILVNENGTVTLSNVRIAQFGCTAASDIKYAPIYVYSQFTGTFNMDNVYVSDFNRGGVFLYGGTFNVTGCYIDCANSRSGAFTKGIEIKGSAHGTIKDTVIVNMERPTTTTDSTAGIEIYGSGTITVDGCSIISDVDPHQSVKATYGIVSQRVGDHDPSGGSLLVTNCWIEVSNAALSVADNPAYGPVNDYSIVVGGEDTYFGNYIATWSASSSITINNGEFNEDVYADAGTIAITGGAFNSFAPYTGTGTIVISGGTFDAPVPAAYCAEGFIPVNDGEGQYGVKFGSYVAQVGETKYEDFAAAWAAVPADGTASTVTLLADITPQTAIVFASGMNVTLDLNGHRIESATPNYYTLDVVNGATVVINDSSAPS
ncbi:MAG: right-handed parallel beta-helix repeat-containing protein, partial [Kiritimatiellae bacterium]|nr:right-handed parallel beta-helix repeat-containing protein [Kiritimatiellia bacterium]